MNKYHAISPLILAGITDYRDQNFPIVRARKKNSEHFFIDQIKKSFSQKYASYIDVLDDNKVLRHYYRHVFSYELYNKLYDETSNKFDFKNRKNIYIKHETEYVNFVIDAMNKTIDEAFYKRCKMNQKLKKIKRS